MIATDLPVAILAGGLATRLRPLTETIPKSLVEVAGEPFLSHQLRQLAAQGLKKVVLCVGYLGEMIAADYGNGSAFGIDLRYSFDGPTLVGTGGAIRKALPELGETFYVLYGDSYLPVDFPTIGQAFLEKNADGLMTVFRNEGLYDTSNVSFHDGRILLYDKKSRTPEMLHIDYGLSLFKADAFRKIQPGEKVDLADIMQDLLAKDRLMGFEVRKRFYEIGSHAGLSELDELLRA
ncbi:MAG: nucleotidyl transferase [Verrucomicrobiaceae bacterium]|nr:MAG: nucleotidyl transferase [Verrucomicrobiaceae bacterium]